MDSTKPKKPRYMDIVGGKRPATVHRELPAKSAKPSATPSPASTKPVRQWNVNRPASNYADPIAARPVSRPAGPGRTVPRPASTLSHPASTSSHSTSASPRTAATSPRPAAASRPQSVGPASARPAAVKPAASKNPTPTITRSTTVKTVAATEDKIESVEFGIIEDLTPVVKPEPPMIPGTRPKEKSSVDTKKSPFLTSVKVPKRPLSASAPTGIHAPAPKKTEEAKAEKSKKKRKNAPFIVIIILSVFLGVSLGALVYFVLPH